MVICPRCGKNAVTAQGLVLHQRIHRPPLSPSEPPSELPELPPEPPPDVSPGLYELITTPREGKLRQDLKQLREEFEAHVAACAADRAGIRRKLDVHERQVHSRQ